ncbi:MAG: SAM-dependent chlorinase/fluorinase [Alphaproteobacteria bacterium]|nr:SAM-dependent chlorinase/fluorinase [Alphaproteobacteria bacterium]
MIVLCTDFGNDGPYIGQMKAVLFRAAPGMPVVDLFADLPAFDIEAAAHLLAAYAVGFPRGDVFLAVVDPGVGTARSPAAVLADGRWFVGPDNGLFQVVAARARHVRWWEITWRPPVLSATFHGRDLFAPIAARLACGGEPPGVEVAPARRLSPDWPAELPRIVYCDRFGNAMTGLRRRSISAADAITVAGRRLAHAATFGAVPAGAAFWYVNANGLVEIAVNRGSAANRLGLRVGDPVHVVRADAGTTP